MFRNSPRISKKKATKFASLVDSDGDIISILNFISNISSKTDQNYLYIKKTFSHDVKIIQDLFNNVIIKFDKRKKVLTGADKGFKTQEIIKHCNKKVTIITPKRQHSNKQIKKMIKERNDKIEKINLKIKKIVNNEKKCSKCVSKIEIIKKEIKTIKEKNKIKYSDLEKEIFRERYKVEDNYKNLKKSERIVIRKDRKINTFMSFIFMDELNRIIKKYINVINENELYDI